MRVLYALMFFLGLSTNVGFQADPRRVTVETSRASAENFWIKLSYQLPGGPDSVITTVRQGSTILQMHRLVPITRDSFALPVPAVGETKSGQVCVQSKRRGLLSNIVCGNWSWSSPDTMPPDPVIDSIVTDTSARPTPTPSPDSGVLFYDNFDNGTRAPAQNGIYWTSMAGGTGEAPTVVPFAGSLSGYALLFRFVGNPLDQNAWSEANMKLAPSGEYFFCMVYHLPANFFHRNDAASDNNKGLRIFGRYVGDPRDSAYRYSAVKAGYSTIPYDTAHQYYGRSQFIVEFGNSAGGEAVGTGNWSVGPWTWWDKPSTVERIGFYVKVATKPGTTGTGTKFGSDGIIKVWRNGVLEFPTPSQIAAGRTMEDLAIYTAGMPNVFTDAYLRGFSNSGFTETTDIYLSSLTISKKPLASCTN